MKTKIIRKSTVHAIHFRSSISINNKIVMISLKYFIGWIWIRSKGEMNIFQLNITPRLLRIMAQSILLEIPELQLKMTENLQMFIRVHS